MTSDQYWNLTISEYTPVITQNSTKNLMFLRLVYIGQVYLSQVKCLHYIRVKRTIFASLNSSRGIVGWFVMKMVAPPKDVADAVRQVVVLLVPTIINVTVSVLRKTSKVRFGKVLRNWSINPLNGASLTLLFSYSFKDEFHDTG